MNLVSAIWSSGCSYSAITKGTLNSQCFLCFLKHMISNIKETEDIDSIDIDPIDIMLILDNAPIHQANVVLEFINTSKLRWVFLPQYSPELAPVETAFAILKQKAWMNANQGISLDSEEGKHLVEEWLQKIGWSVIRKLWARFYTWIRGLLKDVSRL